MKFLLNGKSVPADVVLLHKASDDADVPIRIFNDDGTPIDLSTGVLTLAIYDTANRKNAAVKSYATTSAVEAAGTATITPTVAGNNWGPGTYYAFAKFVLTSGSLVSISSNYVTLKVG